LYQNRCPVMNKPSRSDTIARNVGVGASGCKQRISLISNEREKYAKQNNSVVFAFPTLKRLFRNPELPADLRYRRA